MALALLLSLAPLLSGVGAGPAAGIKGTWDSVPLFTPSCVNGVFPGTEQDPTRTFACQANDAAPPAFVSPAIPIAQLPNYTKDPRRDHHHVGDGPVLGNGNVGVTIGAGNLWNVSYPWIDIYISANSFWALTGANHTVGTPFRGRLALPATMQLGIARLSLPPSFAGGRFHAVQDLDSASVTVQLSSTAGATVTATLFVSPRAPLIWTTLESSGGGEAQSDAGIDVVLNTTVSAHFFHRDPHINCTFPVMTQASCGAGGDDATVTRASDFAGSGEAVVGTIQHSLRAGAGASDQAAATCSVAGKTSASLAFALGKGAPVEIVTAVRTSRDPSCVARPTTAAASKLCGLGADATAAGAKILADAKTVTLAEAQQDHRESWQAFWNVSSISLPDAPETEAFWCASPPFASGLRCQLSLTR